MHNMGSVVRSNVPLSYILKPGLEFLEALTGAKRWDRTGAVVLEAQSSFGPCQCVFLPFSKGKPQRYDLWHVAGSVASHHGHGLPNDPALIDQALPLKHVVVISVPAQSGAIIAIESV